MWSDMAGKLVSKLLFRSSLLTQAVSSWKVLCGVCWVVLVADSFGVHEGSARVKPLTPGEIWRISGDQTILQRRSTGENKSLPDSLQKKPPLWHSGAYGRGWGKGKRSQMANSTFKLRFTLWKCTSFFLCFASHREVFCPMSSKSCLIDQLSSEPSSPTTMS